MSSDSYGDDQYFENPEDALPTDDFQSEEINAKLEVYQFNPDNSEINNEFEF